MPNAGRKPLTPAEIATLAAISLLGLVLRLYDLDGKSLWGDELNMIWFMTGERDLAKSSGNALGYLPILRAMAALGGSDFLFRLPAALAGALTVPLMFAVGDRMLGAAAPGRAIALGSALLLAVSPFHIAYSQEAHAYALFCLLVLLAFYLFWRAYHEGGTWLWIALAVVLGLGFHVHLFTSLVILSGLVVWGLLLVRDRRLLRLPDRRAAALFMIVTLVVVGIAWPLIYDWVLPLGTDLVEKLAGVEDAGGRFDKRPRFEITPALFVKAFKELAVWRTPYHDLARVVFALGFLGFLYLLVRRRSVALVLALWIAVPLLPAALFSHASRIDFGTRRIIFVLPMALVLVAAGLVAIGVALGALTARLGLGERRVAAVALVTVLFVGIVVGPVLTFYYVHLENDDLKRLARLLEREAREGDLLVVWKPEYLDFYYDGPIELLDIASHLKKIPGRWQEAERLWYVRPRTVDNWNLYKPFAEWTGELGALTFRFGGNLLVSFHRREPASRQAMLAERARILETAVELKPRRPYTHASLSVVYKMQKRQDEAAREEALALALRARGRFLLGPLPGARGRG